MELLVGDSVGWDSFVRGLVVEPRPSRPHVDADTAASGHVLGHMLRNSTLPASRRVASSMKAAPQWLSGLVHYRLLPGVFPNGVHYHFDGLATPVRFHFEASVDATAPQLSWISRPFQSQAFKAYPSCLFFGTGSGPKLGTHLCFTNPGVNLLPIEGPPPERRQQLWLTIDTSSWGQVEPDSLATLPGNAAVDSLVLNAHPACDGNQCFVQHPCPPKHGPLPGSPWSDQACFSLLRTTTGDLQTTVVSRTTLPYKKLIQHSHSPCITPRFVLAKLDAFAPRSPLNTNGGLLHYLHQGEDDLWLLLDRTTNRSTVLSSGGVRFVNNHFWNCYEDDITGEVVVETVATTSDYLDTYFERSLKADTMWAKRFQIPLRCRVPTGANQTSVACAPLSNAFNASHPFDYPTFNPHFKMRSDYRYFYAITPVTAQSKWFDQVVKVDVSKQGGTVVASWSSPGVYVTEANFVPRVESTTTADEDDGVLLSVMYNQTADTSCLAVLDAAHLTLLDQYPLGGVVPFHAHGIVCPGGGPCFTNP